MKTYFLLYLGGKEIFDSPDFNEAIETAKRVAISEKEEIDILELRCRVTEKGEVALPE